ncbi:MAG: hypothetical protein J6Y08_04865 [Clostridiales bacterium]|nr:hypothetical protein [Clostridiales bacterium]
MKLSVTRLNQLFPTLLMMSSAYPLEKARKGNRIVMIVMSVISAMLFFFICALTLLAPSTRCYLFLRFLLAGGVGYCLTRAHYALKQSGTPSGLQKQILEIRDVILKETPDPLPAFPFAHPEFEKASLGEKVVYLGIFYRYAEMRNDLMAMAEAAHAYEKLGTLTLTETGHTHVDGTLFVYYSFREKNPELAKKYYQHSRKAIDNDMDCNGRRKLAYYAYYILEDKALARTYLEQGLWALTVEDPRMAKLERTLEERMLGYLKSLLDNES